MAELKLNHSSVALVDDDFLPFVASAPMCSLSGMH